MQLFRPILFVAILALILTFISTLLSKGLGSFAHGQIGKVNNIVRHQTDTDLAIFGSSVALMHFDPQIIEGATGLTCFNYGLDGTTMFQYGGLLKEYVTYSKSQAIIIGSTLREFNNRSEYYGLYRFLEHADNPNIYKSLSMIDRQVAFRMRYIPFYKLAGLDTRTYKVAIEGILKRPYPADEFNVYNGFAPQNLEWQLPTTKQETFKEELDTLAIENFRETVQYIVAKNKKVIIVIPPIYYEGQLGIENLEEFKNIYRSLVGPNIVFLDFTKSKICLNKNNFYNNSHLNANGAKKFSLEFSQQLKQMLDSGRNK